MKLGEWKCELYLLGHLSAPKKDSAALRMKASSSSPMPLLSVYVGQGRVVWSGGVRVGRKAERGEEIKS